MRNLSVVPPQINPDPARPKRPPRIDLSRRCDGKKIWTSFPAAEEAAGLLTYRTGCDYRVYVCSECRQWHIGHHSLVPPKDRAATTMWTLADRLPVEQREILQRAGGGR
jgi:hypothetical protein